MALNLGELVAGIRADAAPFTRSLSRAELAMRGLTRDVNGQLRDLNGRFVSRGQGMGRALGDGVSRGSNEAGKGLTKVRIALLALGPGIPYVAAAATALGGLAAGAVAAGIAVKAFTAAVGPQMEGVKNVAKLAEDAQAAAAAGSKDAAAKQKAYTDALKELPPATQATAKAFIGLKKDYKSWSDGLSSTTMPVVTKGIEILRDLLPTLTPFVKAAASAMSDFLDDVAVGVKSAGFKEWAADMSAAAGPALRDFLAVIKNLAIGFGGLLQAFLPASDGMTGGLVKMTDSFAKWGASLKDSAGFAQFTTLAREGGKTLGELAMAAGKLLVALGPLIGISTQIALALAKMINSLPPGVLEVLATTIAGVVVAMKAYRLYTSLAGTASTLLGTRLGEQIKTWARLAARSIASMARIAARAAVTAARTAASWAAAAARATATWLATMIRVAAVTVARFALMAARAVAWAAVMAAQWLIALGPIGWIIITIVALVALIIANWDRVKAYTLVVWNAIVAWLTGAWLRILAGIAYLGQIPGMIADWFGQAKDYAVAKMVQLLSWLAGLPGRVTSAISGLLGNLRTSATNAFTAFRTAAVQRASAFLSWVRGLPGRIASGIGSLAGLLVSKGRDVVRGLWNGIKSMGSWLKNTLIGWAKNLIPGPIAKALGIASPSKLMAKEVGRWIPAGIVSGIESGQGALDRTMSGLVSTPTAGQLAMSAGGGLSAGSGSASGSASRVVELRSGGTAFGDFIIGTLRDAVGSRGGNVQFVLGR